MQATVDDREQAAALRSARRRATGLLALVTVGFVASFWLPETTATGYLRAALEAGLVGGLADWFAVVALFRHPLGVPIPHTAVIPRSKDGLGANLATFVRSNFLGQDQVRERLVDPAHPRRLGAWLADEHNADRVAAWGIGAAEALLEVVDEDALLDRVATGVRTRVSALPAGELAGRGLHEAVRERRHAAFVTATIEGVQRAVVENRAILRRKLGEQSPGWVPPAIDDLVFERAEHVVRTFLRQVAQDEHHELRDALDRQLLGLAERLRTDPTVQERVGGALRDVLTDDLLRRWIAGSWDQVRAQVAAAAAPEASDAPLRVLTRDALADLGRRLHDDEALQAKVLTVLDELAPRLADVGQAEIGDLIASTIDRWDAQDTAHRLELWMGRDLQFVRINGTVVGALVGVGLYGVGQLLG